jgi:MGT family glycosyltransferase
VPELDYDRRDLPEWVHYVGPCVWNQTAGDALPAWFDALPADQPVVHVTEGTAHHEGPFLLRAAACGLSTRSLQIVATTGPERDPEILDVGPRPANLHLERWLPHSRLLPHCAAVVTTGGAGTIMAALSFGVPLVVVPSHWDKTDNARRVEASGAGIYLPPGKCTSERLAQAVDRVLTEPRFKARAAELANRLALTPGPKGAATLLEQLVCHSVREQQTLVVQGASR